MSISRTVYVRRENMLTPKVWAEAIRAAGFPMEMDADFDVEHFSGFLPCRYDGQGSGFEYFFSTLAEMKADNGDDESFAIPDVGDREIGVSFVTHSSMRGLATAVVAAAVLCAQADGVLYDEEAGELIPAKDAPCPTPISRRESRAAPIGRDIRLRRDRRIPSRASRRVASHPPRRGDT